LHSVNIAIFGLSGKLKFNDEQIRVCLAELGYGIRGVYITDKCTTIFCMDLVVFAKRTGS